MNKKSLLLLMTACTIFQYNFIFADGYTRLNWGCTCSTEGTGSGTLIAAYNNTSTNSCQIIACKTGSSSTCSQQTSKLSFSGEQNVSIAVANTDTAIYVAFSNYNATQSIVRVASYTDAGGFYMPPNPIVLNSDPTAFPLVQWYGLSTTDNSVFLATEAIVNNQSVVALFKLSLTDLSILIPPTSLAKNTADKSIFLYWYQQTSNPGAGLYLLRGHATDQVEVYTVDLATPSITYVTNNDLSSVFYALTTCATSQDYLVFGGMQGGSYHGYFQKFTIASDHSFTSETSFALSDSLFVNRVEKCGCTNSQLLVAATQGFYTFYATDWTNPISSQLGDNSFADCCWCCTDNTTIAVNYNNAQGSNAAYIWQQAGGSFTTICTLPNPPA